MEADDWLCSQRRRRRPKEIQSQYFIFTNFSNEVDQWRKKTTKHINNNFNQVMNLCKTILMLRYMSNCIPLALSSSRLGRLCVPGGRALLQPHPLLLCFLLLHFFVDLWKDTHKCRVWLRGDTHARTHTQITPCMCELKRPARLLQPDIQVEQRVVVLCYLQTEGLFGNPAVRGSSVVQRREAVGDVELLAHLLKGVVTDQPQVFQQLFPAVYGHEHPPLVCFVLP